jgi:hypothetical protein
MGPRIKAIKNGAAGIFSFSIINPNNPIPKPKKITQL